MKKYLLILAAILSFTSCYDDYVKDYDINAVYFAYQTDVRSVIVGEGMRFGMGVALGGVIENKENRVVDFAIDNSLVSAATLAQMKGHSFSYVKELCASISSLEELPAAEYSILVDNAVSTKTVIKKGEHLGRITIKVDSAAFLADVSRTSPRFVVPLRLTKCTGSTILESKSTAVVGVRYENMLFGSYWHGGITTVNAPDGTKIRDVEYYTTIPQPDSRVWSLKTVAPMELTANAVGDEINSSKAQFKITQGVNGALTITPVSGATYVVEADGECVFNRAKLLQDRKIFLQYKYIKDGNTYHAKDTLTFRNRIRDGVNEWQDENPKK